MPEAHDHDHDDHDHDGHHHDHGHHHDQGLKGLLRYLRHLPSMWRSDVNAAVVAELSPSSADRAVDVGAGMGAGVIPLAKTGAEVTAVEPTNYMRAILHARRLSNSGRKRIAVVDGVAENMAIPDNSATALMAVNALHHWSDIETAAAEIARVLESGGRILLVDEQFDDPSHPEFDRFEQDDHDHMFEAAELDRTVAALTAAGLTDVSGEKRHLADVPVLAFRASKP